MKAIEEDYVRLYITMVMKSFLTSGKLIETVF